MIIEVALVLMFLLAGRVAGHCSGEMGQEGMIQMMEVLVRHIFCNYSRTQSLDSSGRVPLLIARHLGPAVRGEDPRPTHLATFARLSLHAERKHVLGGRSHQKVHPAGRPTLPSQVVPLSLSLREKTPVPLAMCAW